MPWGESDDNDDGAFHLLSPFYVLGTILSIFSGLSYLILRVTL